MVSMISNARDYCPYSTQIKSYADCTLDDSQAELVEEHLAECDRCSQLLARTIDGGTQPAWLPNLIGDSTSIEYKTQFDSSAPAPSTFAASLVTVDRYQIVALQGEGGMGKVWQGWDVVMKRRVALKQLRSSGHNDGNNRRLLQEATSLARLSHPNIVSVYEVLMLEQQPTLVMEFIDGPPLSSVSRDGVMSERQAAKILERLTDAIAHAHEQGVIHRDLKPGNVLLCWPSDVSGSPRDLDRAIPKLTDFGLAKILEGNDLTRTGDLLGTPAYMAPEQTIGLASTAGPSTDVYGLGAILYDLLTGTPPHVAENPVSTMLLAREREPTAPRVLRPELSNDIETICLKCLQKLPKDRYASAKEMRDDLRAFLDGRPIKARPVGPIRTAVRWSRRHKPLVASLALAASLLLTLLVGSLWTASNERRLRLDADDAKTQVELSEKKLLAEAQRANDALDVNRQHFEVALDRINRLAHMAYNPINQLQTELDYNREILNATRDIYATYLDTLPPTDKWKLQEAYTVTFYIKYMTAFGNRDVAGPWLDRVKGVVARIESEEPDSRKMREFLAQHYYNVSIHAYAKGDFDESGRSGEQAGSFVDLDARHAAHVLMSAAISYGQAGSHQDAVRAANKSVQAYRTAMKQLDPIPDDPINFLDQLRWHRYIASQASDQDEVDKFVAEFDKLASQFAEGSPHYARAQDTVRIFHSMSNSNDRQVPSQ